jgi:hypothetical protein
MKRILVAALFLAACEDDPVHPPNIYCPAIARPAIEVDVRDADTGAPAANGASGEVREGTFVEALEVLPSTSGDALTMVGAWERPGEYTVLVQKPGHRQWTADDVRVTRGLCNVETVKLIANLEPVS